MSQSELTKIKCNTLELQIVYILSWGKFQLIHSLFCFVVLFLYCSIQFVCLVLLADMLNLTNYFEIVKIHHSQCKYVHNNVSPLFIVKIYVRWHHHSLSIVYSKTSSLTRVSYLCIDFTCLGDLYYAEIKHILASK